MRPRPPDDRHAVPIAARTYGSWLCIWVTHNRRAWFAPSQAVDISSTLLCRRVRGLLASRRLVDGICSRDTRRPYQSVLSRSAGWLCLPAAYMAPVTSTDRSNTLDLALNPTLCNAVTGDILEVKVPAPGGYASDDIRARCAHPSNQSRRLQRSPRQMSCDPYMADTQDRQAVAAWCQSMGRNPAKTAYGWRQFPLSRWRCTARSSQAAITCCRWRSATCWGQAQAAEPAEG